MFYVLDQFVFLLHSILSLSLLFRSKLLYEDEMHYHKLDKVHHHANDLLIQLLDFLSKQILIDRIVAFLVHILLLLYLITVLPLIAQCIIVIHHLLIDNDVIVFLSMQIVSYAFPLNLLDFSFYPKSILVFLQSFLVLLRFVVIGVAVVLFLDHTGLMFALYYQLLLLQVKTLLNE